METDTHTDTQYDYCDSRCAGAPWVNFRSVRAYNRRFCSTIMRQNCAEKARISVALAVVTADAVVRDDRKARILVIGILPLLVSVVGTALI